MKFFAKLSAAVAGFVALTSTGACWVVFVDEPTMPESLIK